MADVFNVRIDELDVDPRFNANFSSTAVDIQAPSSHVQHFFRKAVKDILT